MSKQNVMPAYADGPGERAMQEEELQTYRSTLGERHPRTLVAKNNLGITLLSHGCLLLARELLESALRDGRHVFGKKHPNTLTAMENLAHTLFEAGDLALALKLQKKILKWRCQMLGEEHPNTLAAMVNLSITFCALKDEAGARELDEKVLKIRQRNLGGAHPATLVATGNLATTINNQAVALRNAGHLADAEPLQFEAMQLMIKAYGDDSLDAACTYSAAGALYRLHGDFEQANTYFCKALAIRTRELGPNADLTQLVRTRLHEMLH
jgi:tetratricopeptide (TPR) repeat protein